MHDPSIVDSIAVTTSHRSSRRSALQQLAAGAVATTAALSPLHATFVRAQDATPPAGACPADPATGVAVPFIGVEGDEKGRITIRATTDPFTGYRPSSPPARGNRFILLGVTVENTGINPWLFDPGRIVLQDTEGFVIYPSGVDLGDPPIEPGLGYQEVPPGASVQGVVGYVVLKGTEMIRAFFAPDAYRLVLLADLRRR